MVLAEAGGMREWIRPCRKLLPAIIFYSFLLVQTWGRNVSWWLLFIIAALRDDIGFVCAHAHVWMCMGDAHTWAVCPHWKTKKFFFQRDTETSWAGLDQNCTWKTSKQLAALMDGIFLFIIDYCHLSSSISSVCLSVCLPPDLILLPAPPFSVIF